MKKKFFYINQLYPDLVNLIFVNIVFFFFYQEITTDFFLLRAAIGTPIVLLSFYFETKSNRALKQAHAHPENIKKLVTSGIYAKIRHPIYLGRIFLNIGFLVIFPILPMLIVAIVFVILWYLLALYEEMILTYKFGNKYKKYKKKVPMFIPKK